MPDSLAALEAALSRELEIYAYPDRVWPVTHKAAGGEHVYDVVIVGGGMAGTATTIGLLRERIANVLVVDENDAGREGPWVTWARMITLRTIKELHGPDNGLPSASFRSWYEAQFGAEAYRAMPLIPKEQWMDYLVWLRRVFRLPVKNNARVTRVRSENGHFRITMATPLGAQDIQARKIVLTTGWGGGGGPRIPPLAKAKLDKRWWAHSSEMIDFAPLAGRRVAVVGGNASAFDNAAVALEQGAAQVTQFIRRPAHPEVNTLRYLEFVGLFRNFSALSDEWKLKFTRTTMAQPTPPPPQAIERVKQFANYQIVFNGAWTDVAVRDGALAIATRDGAHTADYAIFGTGFETDLTRLEFLQDLVPDIALWRDRTSLGPDPLDQEIGRHPYLGPAMQCQGRTPESDRVLRNLYFFNGAANPSVGPIPVGLNGMPWGVRAVVNGISHDLFISDVDRFYEGFEGYKRSDFEGSPKVLLQA